MALAGSCARIREPISRGQSYIIPTSGVTNMQRRMSTVHLGDVLICGAQYSYVLACQKVRTRMAEINRRFSLATESRARVEIDEQRRHMAKGLMNH